MIRRDHGIARRHTSVRSRLGESPDLEVGRQQRRLEVNAKPALPQAQSQFDVLDRRLRILVGVESAGLGESLPGYRAAAGPECVDVASGAAVLVAVDKILVLRKKIGRRRVVVITAENRRGAGRLQRLDQHPRAVRVDDNVGIDEPQDLAGRGGGADVACAARPQASAGFEHRDPGIGSNRRAGISRAVVDYDDFSDLAFAPHREQRLEALPQRAAAVVYGHDDRDGRRCGAGAFDCCVQGISPYGRFGRLRDTEAAVTFATRAL